MIDKENRQTHTLIEQVGQAVEVAAMLKNLPVQEHRHTYTLDIKSSKTALVIFVMAVIIVLLIGFIYRISVSNQQLAANDLKYRYIKMKGEATSKRIAELEEIFELNRDNAKIRQMKKDVEEYEQTIQRKVQLEEHGFSYVFSAIIDGNSVSFPNVSIKDWTEVDESGNPIYPIQK